MGWDTKATDKGSVKLPPAKRTDARTVAQEENKKLKQEQAQTAKRYPAIGKAPPSPVPQKPASGSRSVFGRLFGKSDSK